MSPKTERSLLPGTEQRPKQNITTKKNNITNMGNVKWGKKDFEELKRVLPGYETFTELKRVSESEKAGPCPFCGGVDRFRVTEKGWFFCRQCAPDKNHGAGDIVEFHKRKFNQTIPELCKQYLPGYSKADKNKPVIEQSEQPFLSSKDWQNKGIKVIGFALNLLHDRRKIDKKIVSELFEAGQIKAIVNATKNCVAFPFFDLSSENVPAIQYIAVGRKPFPFIVKNGSPANKVFRKGSKPGSDCFFTVGASIQDSRTDLIISESVINAITAHECYPNACSIALGGSTYIRKLESLKPHINGRKVIVCGDYDQAGEKMVSAVWRALDSNVHAISFESADKQGLDINDLLQAGQKDRIIELINDAKPVAMQESTDGADLDPETVPALLGDILQKSAEDPGAVFLPDALEALAYLTKNNKSEYMRWRAKFKKIKDVSVCEIDKSVKGDSEDEEKCRIDDIIKFLKEKVTFCHDSEENSFMIINADDHEELYSVGSRTSNKKIQHMIYTELEESIGEQTMKTVNSALACFGLFDGPEEDIYLRAGRNENGYFIDLCNDKWQVVQIDQFGWKILNRSPVRFRRTQTMQPIPEPDKKSNLSALWQYVNIPESDQIFVLAFILECWRPDTQKPILELTGVQGTGKSNIAETLRDLIDPNSVNLRARPKQIEDVFVSATNNWLVNYNNLSHISAVCKTRFAFLPRAAVMPDGCFTQTLKKHRLMF